MPTPLSPAARNFLQNQEFPGNIRELHAQIERACIFATGDTLSVMDLSSESALLQKPPQKEKPAISLKSYLDGCERNFILQTLEQEEGRIGDTAKRLGISRKNLWERMRRHGIHMNSEDPDRKP